jgi:hypothetical protein
MNKKFLSAILFGALMVTATGTFVSCKDYDDDIKDLQEKVDKLATKEDMTSQIATLQTALTAAAKDASDAITKAAAAETAAKAASDAAAEAKAAADKAVAEAKAESIKAVQAELEALKKEVTEATESALADMRKEVAEATKKVEDIVGKIADMVTSVELVASYSANPTGAELTFSTAIEKENVFSKDIANAITFTKDKQVQTGDKFVVRVSPTNAVLTPDMISLTNSKGQDLKEFLSVQKVEKYDGLLSRAAGNNGLWEVTVALKNYDEKAFAAVTETKVGDATESILFAVQVNNTLSTAETREVISSYDLTLDWTKYVGEKTLNYFVDKTNISKIHNRYTSAEDGTAVTYKELGWKADAATAPIPLDKANTNVKVDGLDNRQTKDLYPAVQGEAIKIALSTADDKVTAPTNIRGMYVVLDKDNAVESAPSELNAWNSYTYSGLNTVVEGTSTEIIINSTTAINDVIGFRVYAVNFDGTLVDPDGKAFYVKLGNAATDWNATATTITALNPADKAVVETQSDKVAVSLTKLNAPTAATWTTDKVNGSDKAFNAIFVNNKDEVLYTTASLTTFTDFSKVTKVYTMPTLTDWKLYEDNKTYNGTLTIKNASGHVLATMKVSMTKVLPTTIPSGFSVKTAQVAEGIYNCYMIPMKDDGTIAWAAETATKGSMKMSEVFNFGTGAAANYNITFAASQKENNKDVATVVAGSGTLEVVKDYINNSIQHATTVVYNYGKISSVKNSDGGYDDVTRAATDFQTVYNCIYNSTYTWAWATREQLGAPYTNKDTNGNYTTPMPSTELTYGTDRLDFAADSFIFGTSTKDSRYSKLLSTPYESSLIIKDATLTSDANGEEEYFDVVIADNHITGFKATALSSETNPTAAVPSTLTIKCKDMYGHDITIKVAMTVKKR